MLADAIARACTTHRFDLLAFVFMPEHVHLLVFPNADPAVSPLLKTIKQGVSRLMKTRLESVSPALVRELTVAERPGKDSFRFWQEGPGYDRNIVSTDALIASIRYIHRNPVARGLCDRPGEWRWSSFLQYDQPSSAAQDGAPRITRRFV